jgi:parallel beta-helix repeat protein
MANFTVTTLADEPFDNGNLAAETDDGAGLSLREALALANANGAAEADTITFAAGGTLFLTTGQELAITTDGITVDGDIDNDGKADIEISADLSEAQNDTATSRVFVISDGGTGTIAATLNGLVIRDGNGGALGGGIYVGQADALTLTNTTVSGNSAFSGGGIFGHVGSSITLTNATVAGNSGAVGSGIFGNNNAAITLTNATVSGNSAAAVGGGIYGGRDSSITLTNATVSGNSGRDGGGIYGGVNAVITLTNATVSGNSAGDDGGGIFNFGLSATTSLTNSIVAGNAAAGLGDDLFGGGGGIITNRADLVFTGGNIIGSVPANFATTTSTPTATINGTSQAALETVFAAVALVDPDGPGVGNDPFFSGVLADNGGAVETIALAAQLGNPAINTGTGTLPPDTQDLDRDGNTAEALPVDARSQPRTALGGADIGAFEVQAIPLVVTTLDDELDAADTVLATANPDDLSLREALALANGNPDDNTITFAAGLAGGTLFLTTGQQLAITTTGITIDGDINNDGKADIEISADSAEGANDATSRVFFISNAVANIAATLNGLIIRDGNGGFGGGIYVGFGDELTLTNATVSGNSAAIGGGIFGQDGSSIALTNATVSGNSASGNGGGIVGQNSSSITLTNATVSGNHTDLRGGGIFGFEVSSITLTNATVSSNSAGTYGGGITGNALSSITLTNATVSGNSAASAGGGIFSPVAGSSIALTNSIVAGNDAPVGDDLRGFSGSTLTFAGGNILGSDPVGFGSITGAPTPINGADPAELGTVFAAVAADPNTGVLAGVLADNGGRVQTIALNPDAANPAIDTGDPDLLDEAQAGRDLNGDGDQLDTITTDARGFARDVDFDGNPPTPDLGAFEQQNAGAFVVTTLDDELDAADPNLATANLNDLSLREALALANGDPTTADTITFAAALTGGTLFLTTGQELAITTDGVTVDGDIDGNGAPDIEISADSAEGANDANSRVFVINDGSDATIAATLNGLVIRDGNAAGTGGGGILVGGDDALALTNATVSGNSALYGGGIASGGFDAAITLTHTTIYGNSARYGGGLSNSGTATLTDTTLSGNSAVVGGGMNGNYGASITLTNTTVSGNSATIFGGGIYNFGAASVTTLANSIVAGNAASSRGDDLCGALDADLVFVGGNVIGSTPENFVSTTGAPTATIVGTSQTDLETVFAQVANNPHTGVLSGVLADNGGRVQTVALNPDAANPAIDKGDPDLLDEAQAGRDLNGDGDQLDTITTDARGFARDVDFDGTPPTPDLGAFEQQNAEDFIVTTLADGGADDFGGGDLAAEQADGDGLSLREALGLANGDPTNANTITFDEPLAGGVLFLQSGQLLITTDGITVDGDIDGNGTPDIEISADSAEGANDATSRVFLIEGAGAIAATLNGLVIRDGIAGGDFPANSGGGIEVGVADALTLTNATVVGNSAGSFGGGISGSDDASITVTNSTVSGNSAGGGGGIYGSDDASITLTNATVSGNSAGSLGGGILGDIYSSITLTNATISGNSAGIAGGGIWGLDLSITLTNATVSGNSAGYGGGGISGDYHSSITLTNSIIAGNDAPDGDDLRSGISASTLTFAGGNILGSDPVGFGTPTGPAPTAINGADPAELGTVFAAVAADPNTGVLSGVLADNGGAVQTIALNPDAANPAIDTGTGTLPADTHDLDGDGDTTEPLPIDARGFARDVDFDGTPPTPDLGAFEQQNTVDFIVTTLADGGDDDFGGGDLAAEEADGDGLSLREALGLANGDPTNANTITFDEQLADGVLALAQGNGELEITSDGITIDGDIDGNGTADIAISADTALNANDATSRVFHVHNTEKNEGTTIAAVLNGLIIQDGNASGVGGGIYVTSGNALTLSNSSVTGNDAHGFGGGGGIAGAPLSKIALTNSYVTANNALGGGNGGGISASTGAVIALTYSTVSGNYASGNGGGISSRDATITLVQSTLFENHAYDSGGAIFGNGASAVITLIDSTASANSALQRGGGIATYAGASSHLINSTVSGNSSGADGGAIHTDAGLTTLTNSIVAGNAAGGAGNDLHGGSTSDLEFTGGNIIGSDPVNFTVTGAPTAQIDGTDQAELETVFADVALVDPDGAGGNDPFFAGVLADNGGAVETVLILRGGIAQNAGDNAELPADSADLDGDGNTAEPLPLDARGLPRVAGVTVDVGAVELDNVAPVNTLPAALSARANLDQVIAGLAVADPDAGELTTTLQVANGILTVAALGGAAVAGSGGDTVTITGTTAEINATLSAAGNVIYHGDLGFVGTDALTMTTDDGAARDIDEVSIEVQSAANTGDFNADAFSDILWRHVTGTTNIFLMNGATVLTDGNISRQVDNTWKIQDKNDFNGDGTADILWRNDNGLTNIFLMNGHTVLTDGNISQQVDNTWKFQDTADFNGDGHADILWRNDDGTTNIYHLDGHTVFGDGNISVQVDNTWKIAGAADFNGDGNADILWRNTVDGTSNIFLMDATTVLTDGNISAQLDNNWTVQDTADFNGDGHADILFRHSDGTARVFLMDGHTVAAELDLTQQLDNNWKFGDTGDFNADGNADIAWRHADGTVKLFFMDGAAVTDSADTSVFVDNTWELV